MVRIDAYITPINNETGVKEMARYTRFDQFKDAATDVELNCYETVWLRDCDKVLSVRYNLTHGTFIYSLAGDHISEEIAQDLFNLEMRVYGWVSTERHRVPCG